MRIVADGAGLHVQAHLALGLVLGRRWYNQAAGRGTSMVELGLELGGRWYSHGAALGSAVAVALQAPPRPQQEPAG